MIALSMDAYRVSINTPLLEETASQFLSQAETVSSLQDFLGWENGEDILKQGFAPQKNAKELIDLLKKVSLRDQLAAKREASNYHDFISPRKGLIKGWLQKKRDAQELALPIGLEVHQWLQSSARLNLLLSLHDALLATLATGEPKRVSLEEMTAIENPLWTMVAQRDLARAERLVEALTSPLKKVRATVIIDDLAFYVLNYDRKRGVSYYWASP